MIQSPHEETKKRSRSPPSPPGGIFAAGYREKQLEKEKQMKLAKCSFGYDKSVLKTPIVPLENVVFDTVTLAVLENLTGNP